MFDVLSRSFLEYRDIVIIIVVIVAVFVMGMAVHMINNVCKSVIRGQMGPAKGFSIMELLISMSIIATVLVFLIGVFTTGMRANRKSVDLTAGVLVAESVISQELYGILADPYNSDAFFKSNYSASSEYVKGTRYNNNTKFTYKMFVKDVTNIGDSGSSGAKNAMKKVDVQVWWWNDEKNGEPADDWRAGYGVVSVGLTRLVNQQSKM